MTYINFLSVTIRNKNTDRPGMGISAVIKIIAETAALTLLLGGCANVQPWERGNLAKPIMAADPSPLQSSNRQHNYASREAAGAASSGASGGGCGCN